MRNTSERLTNDRVAAKLTDRLDRGSIAPGLAKMWRIYIKLNYFENKLEPKQPFEKDKSNYYNLCPGCGRRIRKSYALPQFKPNFCENCGQALRWEDKDNGR